MSMVFYQRDSHIAEIQMGKSSIRLEDALSAENFDINNLPYITLIGRFQPSLGYFINAAANQYNLTSFFLYQHQQLSPKYAR